VQILRDNNRQERKISSQTAVELQSQKRNEDITEELERNLQTQFQLYIYKSGKMLKMIKKNHNKRILKLCMEKNAGRPTKNILY
jgi:hypothetical protein